MFCLSIAQDPGEGQSSIVKGNIQFKIVNSNSKKNFCLNICVPLWCESIVAIPDSSWLFAKGLAKGKLGGVVDTG